MRPDLIEAIGYHSAVATESQALWAKCTFYLGLFGTIALLVTLYYTRRSAAAAQRGVEIAGRALTELERPHLYVTAPCGVQSDEDPGGHLIAWTELTITNYGRSPGEITECYAGVSEIDFEDALFEREDLETVIGASTSIDGYKIQFAKDAKLKTETSYEDGRVERAWIAPDVQYFLAMRLSYKGIGDRTYRVVVDWVWDNDASRWKRVNYERS